MKRKLLLIILILTMLLAFPIAIWAATIDTPDDPIQLISNLEAFRGVLEVDDQLHIVGFDMGYSGANPAEDANEVWLFRLSDNDTIRATVAPFAFFDDGYAPGIVSFYFAADDTNIPTWQSVNLSVQMIGNPALAWTDGDPPSTNSTAYSLFSDSVALITARVRVIASAIEDEWGIDLIETVQGRQVLTSNGEEYFETSIANLRTFAPDLFSDTTVNPKFDEREFTQSFANATETRWESSNTSWDLTPAATTFGGSRLWITALLYVGFSVGMVIVVNMRVQSIRASAFIFGVLMLFGSFWGFMPFVAGIFAGIAGALAMVYAIFYRSSP